MTDLVIGINGGGTRTTFVLVDAHGTELGRTDGGPSNANYIGVEAAQAALRQGIELLLAQNGVSKEHIGAVGAALAGVDRSGERAQFTAFFSELFPAKALTLDNDAIAALVGGVGRPYGVVTICGTGMIALGVNERGERARAGGWGHFVDEGSGYAIGRAALNAVARAHDGSGMATTLTERFLSIANAANPTQMIPWLYAADRRIDQIAALAAEVVAAAETGDLVSIRILARAARVLTSETANVAQRLGFDTPEAPVFPVLMSGSLFMHSALLRDSFTSALQTVIPNAAPFTTERDAAVGAAMMALAAMGAEQPAPTLTAPDPRQATERRNVLTLHIHQQPTLDLVTLMNLEDERVPAAVADQLPRIAALIDAIAERFAQGGRIFMTGAGTSGRLAVLDAAECVPTFGTTDAQVVGILAGGMGAMFHAVEGAEDDETAGRAAIAERQVGPLDTVIGVAASGRTPFVRGTLIEAGVRGALTGCVVNVVRAPLCTLVQHPITLATGPEALTGSTRLKAGSAQKMALNMISTGVMARVGRTYGNLMTDMRMSNIKLRGRAVRIVADATGLDETAARDLLERCGGEMKTAIAAALLNLEPETARERLNAAHGNLNRMVNV